MNSTENKSHVLGNVEKEFIFKFLILNKVSLEFKYQDNTTFAFLLKQSSKELQVEITSFWETPIQENTDIDIFFYFQNNYHHFRSTVIKIQGNTIILLNPEKITKNQKRKYDRKQINGKLSINFKIQGDLILLNYPTTERHYYPIKPPLNADFHDVDIQNILKKFNKKMSLLVSDNKIKMLRNYKTETIEEKMVIKYGKIFYIPDVTLDFPQTQISSTIQIILKGDWAKFEKLINKTQPYLINQIIAKYIVDLSNHDIFSKAIVPVIYRNYVVGLIYLTNHLYNKRKPINLNILNYAHQFSRLLSYSLKHNNYFKEEEKNSKYYTIPIHDFSPGGLSIKHENNFYEDLLLLNHNINLVIEINEKKIEITAKLVRKFRNDSFYYYGFMFIDIKKDDHTFLDYYYKNEL
jgi:hypothetical protein